MKPEVAYKAGVHRDVFFKSFDEPYQCFLCHEEVERATLWVHHIDGERTRNVPPNLAPMHPGCHARLHRYGKKDSAATREQRRQSVKASWDRMSPEERQARGEAMSAGWAARTGR